MAALAFTVAGLWLARSIDGYVITSAVAANALPDPLAKEVSREAGAWLANYQRWPWLCGLPLLAYLGVRSCARASLAFYNTTADIDRFLAALGGVRKEMGYAE